MEKQELSTPALGLPKRDTRHVCGEQAVANVRAALPSAWIVREIAPDYGIDLQIEIVDESQSVTGAMILAQVKGTSDLKRNSVQAKLSSVRYWHLLPLPVIVLLVAENDVRWIEINDFLLREDWLSRLYTTSKKTLSISFANANLLPLTSNELRAIAEVHQRIVRGALQQELDEAQALDITCHALVYVFGGDINKMLCYLREKAPDQMLLESYPQAYWLKSRSEADPNFLDHITRVVVQQGFVEPPMHLLEKYST